MASDHNHPFSKHQAAQAIYLQDLLGAYQYVKYDFQMADLETIDVSGQSQKCFVSS